MVYVYLICSSVLLFLFGGAVTVRRDENEGIALLVLTILGGIVTLLRIANFISKAMYRHYSTEQKRVTVSDLMLFDGALIVFYGILAGIGHQFTDAYGWWMLLFVGVPLFLLTARSIKKRFEQAIHLRNVRDGLER